MRVSRAAALCLVPTAPKVSHADRGSVAGWNALRLWVRAATRTHQARSLAFAPPTRACRAFSARAARCPQRLVPDVAYSDARTNWFVFRVAASPYATTASSASSLRIALRECAYGSGASLRVAASSYPRLNQTTSAAASDGQTSYGPVDLPPPRIHAPKQRPQIADDPNVSHPGYGRAGGSTSPADRTHRSPLAGPSQSVRVSPASFPPRPMPGSSRRAARTAARPKRSRSRVMAVVASISAFDSRYLIRGIRSRLPS